MVLMIVKGGFDREFTKSLIIRDFDDVLKNPFRCVDHFLLQTLLSKQDKVYNGPRDILFNEN